MNKTPVEEAAKRVLRGMYAQRHVLWPNENRLPHEMIEPSDAARFLGVQFSYQEELGRFGFNGEHFEIAGHLDRKRSIISVALRFQPEVVRFTAAHEIGHWVLHEGMSMHRDRPIKGLRIETGPRSRIEAEADHFAACFLMPERLVTEAVQGTFRVGTPIFVDETVAFHLRGNDGESLLQADTSGLERELAVASVESFNGRHFYSLAQQFRVSVTSMAIRLRELNLVRA